MSAQSSMASVFSQSGAGQNFALDPVRLAEIAPRSVEQNATKPALLLDVAPPASAVFPTPLSPCSRIQHVGLAADRSLSSTVICARVFFGLAEAALVAAELGARRCPRLTGAGGN